MTRKELCDLKDIAFHNIRSIHRAVVDGRYDKNVDLPQLEASKALHEAACMELQIFSASDRSCHVDDLFFAIEHLAEHAEKHPEYAAIINTQLSVLRKIQALGKGGAS